MQSGDRSPHSKILETPRRPGVASFTNRKIFAAESTFAVVTSHATLAPSRSMMVERLGCSHLSSLRQSRPYLVAFVAGNFLMLCMIEADAKRRHKFRRSRIASQLMTSTAGRNVAPA